MQPLSWPHDTSRSTWGRLARCIPVFVCTPVTEAGHSPVWPTQVRLLQAGLVSLSTWLLLCVESPRAGFCLLRDGHLSPTVSTVTTTNERKPTREPLSRSRRGCWVSSPWLATFAFYLPPTDLNWSWRSFLLLSDPGFQALAGSNPAGRICLTLYLAFVYACVGSSRTGPRA
jgi:hypothetical protein